MKNQIIVILGFLVLLMCARCTQTAPHVMTPSEDIYSYDIDSSSLRVITIDSCEYIAGYSKYGNGGPVLTHKGNCKYCLARNKKSHE